MYETQPAVALERCIVSSVYQIPMPASEPNPLSFVQMCFI